MNATSTAAEIRVEIREAKQTIAHARFEKAQQDVAILEGLVAQGVAPEASLREARLRMAVLEQKQIIATAKWLLAEKKLIKEHACHTHADE